MDKLELHVMDLDGASKWHQGDDRGRTVILDLPDGSNVAQLEISQPDGLTVHCLMDHDDLTRLMIRAGALLELM